MELTSEQAHHLGGAAALAIAVVLLLAETRNLSGHPLWVPWEDPRAATRAAPTVHYLVPVALLIWGVRSMTHPLPRGAEATAGVEGLQHVWIGLVVALTGAIEALHVAGRLKHRGWGLVLPAGIAVVAALFFVHAQHATGAPPDLLVVQHRIIGATLGVAALTKAMAERSAGFRVAWPVVVLLFGIELLLYTEGSAPHAH